MATKEVPARRVRFELHIRPLMRLLDRDQMLLIGDDALDLTDYDEVKAKAGAIFDRVSSQSMPLRGRGGPWPQEWIGLFKRWMDEDFGRLEMWNAGSYELVRNDNVLTLTASGTAPDQQAANSIWFERFHDGITPREYTLCLEPTQPPVPELPMPFMTKVSFIPDLSERYLIVHEKDAVRRIAIRVQE